MISHTNYKINKNETIKKYFLLESIYSESEQKKSEGKIKPSCGCLIFAKLLLQKKKVATSQQNNKLDIFVSRYVEFSHHKFMNE
jgi:hypothetical protein